MQVGVVIERRDLTNPWADAAWTVTGVVAGWGGRDDGSTAWLPLEQGSGYKRWLAGPMAVELFKRETTGYKVNLGQPTAQLYVILRKNDDPATHHEIDLFHVTACPYEAESYAGSGDEIICGTPMPPEMIEWLARFTEHHHVEVEFQKRRQKSKRHAIPERTDSEQGEGDA